MLLEDVGPRPCHKLIFGPQDRPELCCEGEHGAAYRPCTLHVKMEKTGEELPLLLTAHEDCHRKEDDCSC
jgi:hypothetical protein